MTTLPKGFIEVILILLKIFGRNDELELIEQIRTMVEARYGQISSSVAERADEEEFDSYENDYAYTSEEYQSSDGSEGGDEAEE